MIPASHLFAAPCVFLMTSSTGSSARVSRERERERERERAAVTEATQQCPFEQILGRNSILTFTRPEERHRAREREREARER